MRYEFTPPPDGDEQAALEAQLAQALETMVTATGCDDAEAERLLAKWDELDAHYTRLMAGGDAPPGARATVGDCLDGVKEGD
jgi:hypothetical protein